jgi:hypothetical protein
MGKAIRRIPCRWEHPRDEKGNYLPLIDRSYDEALADYGYAATLWEQGRHPSQVEWPEQTQGLTYEQWDGMPPDPRFYRRESWTEDNVDCVALYETITEGTPISPTFPSLDDLFAWMLEHGYAQADVDELERIGLLPTMIAYKHGSADDLL